MQRARTERPGPPVRPCWPLVPSRVHVEARAAAPPCGWVTLGDLQRRGGKSWNAPSPMVGAWQAHEGNGPSQPPCGTARHFHCTSPSRFHRLEPRLCQFLSSRAVQSNPSRSLEGPRWPIWRSAVPDLLSHRGLAGMCPSSHGCRRNAHHHRRCIACGTYVSDHAHTKYMSGIRQG